MGIDYTVNPLVPGLQFFRCEPMRATLSTKACAANWRAVHDGDDDGAKERLFRCGTCPVGALHAGEAHASLSSLKGMTICGRCHRGTTRLVGKHLCPSCWNRERETLIGRNARGKKPQKLAMVHARALRVMEGDEPRMIKRKNTAEIEELYVMALRDCARRVTFCWDAGRPALFNQRTLW